MGGDGTRGVAYRGSVSSLSEFRQWPYKGKGFGGRRTGQVRGGSDWVSVRHGPMWVLGITKGPAFTQALA